MELGLGVLPHHSSAHLMPVSSPLQASLVCKRGGTKNSIFLSSSGNLSWAQNRQSWTHNSPYYRALTLITQPQSLLQGSIDNHQGLSAWLRLLPSSNTLLSERSSMIWPTSWAVFSELPRETFSWDYTVVLCSIAWLADPINKPLFPYPWSLQRNLSKTRLVVDI